MLARLQGASDHGQALLFNLGFMDPHVSLRARCERSWVALASRSLWRHPDYGTAPDAFSQSGVDCRCAAGLSQAALGAMLHCLCNTGCAFNIRYRLHVGFVYIPPPMFPIL